MALNQVGWRRRFENQGRWCRVELSSAFSAMAAEWWAPHSLTLKTSSFLDLFLFRIPQILEAIWYTFQQEEPHTHKESLKVIEKAFHGWCLSLSPSTSFIIWWKESVLIESIGVLVLIDVSVLLFLNLSIHPCCEALRRVMNA